MKFNLKKRGKGHFWPLSFCCLCVFLPALWGAFQRLSCAFTKSPFSFCPPRYGFVILCTPNFLFLSFGSFSSTSKGKTFESHFYGGFTSKHIGFHVLGDLSLWLFGKMFVFSTVKLRPNKSTKVSFSWNFSIDAINKVLRSLQKIVWVYVECCHSHSLQWHAEHLGPKSLKWI